MEGEFPQTTLQTYGTQDEMVLDLSSGRLDAVMADSVALDLGFLKTPGGADYAFFGEPYSIPKYHGEGAGIGVRKEDTALRDKLSAAIDAIRAERRVRHDPEEVLRLRRLRRLSRGRAVGPAGAGWSI